MKVLREIQIESLESMGARYTTPEWSEDLEMWPPGVLGEYVALHVGQAVVILPDGKRYWLPVRPREVESNLHGPEGAAILSAVLDHNAIADHEACDMFLERDSNSLASAFCVLCGRLVDLTEDVRKMDEQGNREG